MIKVGSKKELISIIKKTIYQKGLKVDLGFIDTSSLDDLSCLFIELGKVKKLGAIAYIRSIPIIVKNLFRKHIIQEDKVIILDPILDISKWDTKNIINMTRTFCDSKFNGDISNWNVENVRIMEGMFMNSKFNGDISKWNTGNVVDMSYMFESSRFNQNISDWDVRNVRDMSRMFSGATFDHDIGQWNVKNLIRAREIFGAGSKFNHNLFIWTTKCPDNINLRELIPERLLVRLPINLWIEYDNSTYY
jgi:surface protein